MSRRERRIADIGWVTLFSMLRRAEPEHEREPADPQAALDEQMSATLRSFGEPQTGEARE